ncbi:MAG: DUF2088 domain-containing protein [Firmicutes bacterium]|nr:DUF2088 domain-containing protein [Bacillota bacterium]
MGAISELLKDVALPKMALIEQRFDDTHLPVEAIPEILQEALEQNAVSKRIFPGMRIAVTAGSRGITNIALILRAIVDYLRSKGAVPFIVPAMGSHGGATAEGQRTVIAAFGITEESMGCEIFSSMETVLLGPAENGKPVYCDKYAYQADGILVVGRVKAHTAFRGPYESGICKMMCIGLGKQKGAEVLHADGFGQMCEEVPMFARVFLEKAPIIGAVALLENAYDQTREIVALDRDEIMDEEPALLLRAKSYMPRILFDPVDVLVVDEMGKNISGDGMDPNITGRFPTVHATGGITAQRVAVLDLTEETHGNAAGMGLADVTCRRLYNKVDFEQTYPNSITNTITEVAKIPMVLYNDREAIQMALKSCNYIDRANPRIVRIVNTMEMRHIWISEALLPLAEANPQVTVLSSPAPFAFDSEGNLEDLGGKRI